MSNTATSLQTFYPTLRYVDARAAIAWLIATFGFSEAACYLNEDGSVAHAELRFGDGLIMLGSPRDDDEHFPVRPPSQRAGLTGGVYVAVPADEIEAHYARAKSGGARIHTEIRNTEYGSREYSAFDPEGYIWAFGTYRP